MYEVTPFQNLVLSTPEDTSVALLGGRGGGKSFAIALLILATLIRHGKNARILYLRQGPYASMEDFIETLRNVFDNAFGVGKHHLKGAPSRRWLTPTGGYLTIGILPDGEKGRQYYERTYQGRSFTMIVNDEGQQYASPDVLDLLQSNMRGGNIPTRRVFAANPGGIGHQWIAQRHVFNAHRDWDIYTDTREVRLPNEIITSKSKWITCPSTYKDNPHNGAGYVNNLALSANHDRELLLAWISGNWQISRGAFFASAMDSPWLRIQGWERGVIPPGFSEPWLAFDHGSESPSACYVMVESEGAEGADGYHYAPGSILVLDEYVSHQPGNLTKGLGGSIENVTPGIKQLAARWSMEPWGYADDAIFSNTGGKDGPLSDQYEEEGVFFERANKGLRVDRFQKMKTMFANTNSEERPGLFIDNRCQYAWDTIPFIVHDPRDREVPVKCNTDHGLDAISYGLNAAGVHSGVAA